MKGFTLIETLVGIAAMTVLGVMAATIMVFSSEESMRQNERGAVAIALLRTQSVLASDLSQASARRFRRADGSRAEGALAARSVRGDGVFLEIVRSGWERPRDEPRPTLQTVSYRIAKGVLERGTRERVDGSSSFIWSPLVSGIDAVEIDFLDYDEWAPSWGGAPDRPLPQAIRIRLTLANERGAFEHVTAFPGARS